MSELVSSTINAKSLSSITTGEGLELFIQSNDLEKVVIQSSAQYYNTVNVQEALTNLMSVGKCLQVAYAGTKGHASCVAVTKILSKYQTLLKNSFVTTAAFVDACVQALNCHRLALLLVEKKKITKGMKQIAACAKAADKMMTKCAELVSEAQTLTDLSANALETAVQDETIERGEQKKVQEMIQQLQVDQAKLKQLTSDLEAQVQEHKVREEQARERTDAASRKAFVLGMVSTFVPFMGKGMTEQQHQVAEEERKSEENISAHLRELEKEKREKNGELAASIEQLKNCSHDKSEIEKAIKSLEVAVKTLGRIKTIFENTRLFWLAVKCHCESLTNVSSITELSDEEELFEEMQDEMRKSAIRWMSLGRINYTAHQRMVEVDAAMDNIMCNLPGMEECPRLIQEVSTELLASLHIEEASQ